MGGGRGGGGVNDVSVFLGRFYRIFFILAGNNDIHKSLNEIEVQPDPTMTI